MSRLIVELTGNRDVCGRLTLLDDAGKPVCGPFATAARSSDVLAAANGNRQRASLQRYGDTPTGRYVVRHLFKSSKRNGFPPSWFGPNGIIVIEGISGNAALAEANGRFHFLICGGELSPNGELRSTAGGLRIENDAMGALFPAMMEDPCTSCEIVERDRMADNRIVFLDRTCSWQDPIVLPGFSPRHGLKARKSRQLGAAGFGGAMMLAMTVSFVTETTSPVKASMLQARPSHAWGGAETGQFLPTASIMDRHFVKLAYGTAPPTHSAVELNMDNFVNYMDEKSVDASTHKCGAACRDGLKAGGLDVSGHPKNAGDYGPFLENLGASAVSHTNSDTPPADYKQEKGDIAVFQVTTARPNGHVEVWDGKRWISDFKQNNYSPYQKNIPPSTIYRFPKKK
ncbi:hypothetical protein FJ930_28635 [Mesorhizobium sp. B2-4-15]|uniref:hypothetical protein n=1 Tax=Mesorhizobium sp. B2-4-15 TaxID=2589934 RepID=UPI00115363BB|nr:hypothetical protein [Mesorhizobium sp. B2-4-15]TPK60446.1 hypothetical protein FJ930_28635 [Mesorhizobium sp. B2-4-15]